MDGGDKVRGYDDSNHLRRMAEGLVAREFGSVDEAAKAVIGEESGSNVDRLRRKFREQGWYEIGLGEYVDRQIAARGLVKPNSGARLCIRIEEWVRNPLPVLIRLGTIFRLLAARRFDVDGRPITTKEKVGGILRMFCAVMLPILAFNALAAVFRKDGHDFGSQMLDISMTVAILGLGMYWNRLAISGDLARYVEADDRWTEIDRQRRRQQREALEGKRGQAGVEAEG